MLEEVDLNKRTDKQEYKSRIEILEPELGALQRRAREFGIPVVVVFEGWDAAGKGTLINRLMLALDARGFTVHPIGPPTEDELLRPWLWRFWSRVPGRGRIAIFDRSWYGRVLVERIDKLVPKSVWRQAYEEILSFERQLSNGGTCIVKLFLHIGKGEQRKRFRKLEKNAAMAWKVGKAEWRQHRLYDDYRQAVEEMIEHTSTDRCPWTMVAADHGRTATLQVFDTVTRALESCIVRAEKGTHEAASAPRPVARGRKGKAATPAKRVHGQQILRAVDLSGTLDRSRYEELLEKLQRRLRNLEHEIYVRRVGVVIAYEGWDAAGKGGNIRRLVQGLDPRGFEVIPVAAPNDVEKTHHYLWRFWLEVPKAGHIAIFDRSWYGRVLVERVEGFCSREKWTRAYAEINDMERQWTDSGIIVVKFWLHIDRKTQLERFKERQRIAQKRWKITDEDWRNREKWDRYEAAVDDMLAATSPPNAPWTIVESNCKLHARLKAIRTVVKRIEERLGR